MNSFKNKKTHLDDLLAEARTQNVTPAEVLLKTAIPQNSFKNGFVKIGVVGLAAISAVSFFFLKDDEVVKNPKNLVKAQTEVVQNITQENSAEKSTSQTAENKTLQPFKKVIQTKASVESEKPKVEFRELQQTPESIQLSAIPLVELRDFELKKLGIEVLDNGDLQLTQSYQNGKVHFIHNITQRPLTPEDEKQLYESMRNASRNVTPEEHARVNPPAFSPKRITDLSGTRNSYIEGDTENSNNTPKAEDQSDIPPDLLDFFQNASQRTMTPELRAKLQDWAIKKYQKQKDIEKTQKYIPIKAGNFIAWFRTSEEVLERLPDFTANTIRAELSGKDLIIQTEEFREEYPTSGFCYLDLCEKANGAIICAKVFPNPAQDKRTILNYELAEERNIITALYDLSGRKLREFSSLKTQQKGRHEEEISLAGIEKGIYLVAIITDQGEKLSRRIIID